MGKNRRDMILGAAERLLRHNGWNKTTVADIAREARVGVGTVYLEFRSKDAIITELSGASYRRVLRAMRRAAMRQLGWADRGRAMMGARVEVFWELADTGAHSSDLVHCSCEGVQAALARFERAQLDLLVDFLGEGHEASAFAVPDPEATASSMLAAYARFTPPWLYQFERARADALLEELHRVLFEGLLAR